MILKNLFYIKVNEQDSEEQQSKVRLINNCALMAIIICFLMTIAFYIFNFWQGKIILSGSAIVLSIVYYAFRKGYNMFICTNIYLTTAAITFFLCSFYSGMFQSPMMYWTIVLPMYAFWILGKKLGIVWLIVALLIQNTILTLGTLQIHPKTVFNFYDGKSVPLLYISLLFLIVNIAVFCYDFETGKFRALFKMKKEKEDLEKILQALNITKLELERAEKHKDLFLSQMSHEMRTPMNAIIGISNVLLNKKQDEDLNIINKSAKHLLSIIDEILDIAKIQSGKFSFNFQDINLIEQIETTLKPLELKAMEKSLSWNLTISPKVPKLVNTDPVRLSQIINNIVGNAIKFTQKGKVSIAIDFEKNYFGRKGFSRLKLIIADTGIGIPKENLKRIFQPFMQSDDQTYKKFGGTGLGLSITKQLIDLIGGEIFIETKPMQGTTISLHFPLKTVTNLLREIPDKNLDENIIQKLNGLYILVADDYDINRIVTKKALWSIAPNMKIDEATTGQEVIAKIQQQQYDCILMDVQMPEMDGLETTAWIRNEKKPVINQLKIIGLTSYAMKEDRYNCIEAGMDDYLSKPFEVNELGLKIVILTG